MPDRPMTLASTLTALDALLEQKPPVAVRPDQRTATIGDRRDGAVYLLDKDLLLAIKVAVVTGRPLLLTGDPGSGKSSVAAYLGLQLRWRYYEHVVTSRMEASDLLWQFDTVRKLGDATGQTGLVDSDYVEPGALWWAFDPHDAGRRGARDTIGKPESSALAAEPHHELNAGRSVHHAVVLVDEIDKADPDVPNALLVPLGSNQFVVRETQVEVRLDIAARAGTERRPMAPPVLVIITSNGERDLPPAFVRRCITFRLVAPDVDRLVEIALAHAALEGRIPKSRELARIQDLAERTVAIREEQSKLGQKGTGTAEFLDAVRAARQLKLFASDTARWDELLALTLRKDAARA